MVQAFGVVHSVRKVKYLGREGVRLGFFRSEGGEDALLVADLLDVEQTTTRSDVRFS
jgi:hypothetical protein